MQKIELAMVNDELNREERDEKEKKGELNLFFLSYCLIKEKKDSTLFLSLF